MKRVILLFVVLWFAGSVNGQDNVQFTFNHVALSVKNLEQSAEFYATVLNLDEIDNRTQNPERRWFSLGEDKELHLILNAGDITLNMGVHMALTTAQFDTFLKNVRDSGTPYFDWAGTPETVSLRSDGIRQIYLQDPDGYWIEVNSVASDE